MGLIEAILLGIQFKRLQKPLVFFSMLISLVAFSIFGVGIIGALITELASTDKEFTLQLVGASFGLLAISGVFFGLAWVCGYLIKRYFE
jgi:polyferredoxin